MVTLSLDKLRRLQRVGLYSGFGLLVFIIALYASFPYERAKDAAITWISKNLDLDAEIASAGPAFGIAVNLQDIRLRTRPPTGKPSRFTIESAKVSLSPFSLLTSSKSITVVADAFGGKVTLDFNGSLGKKGAPFAVELHARDIAAGEIPIVKEAINLVLTGTFKLDGEIKSETGKFADAKGSIAFSCTDCAAGDGKTPLKISGGLTLPRVRLGQLNGTIAIDKGTAKLQGVETKSPDGEASLEGDISLRDPFGNSGVNLYLRFRLNDALVQKAAAFQLLLQTAAAPAKRPDGAYGFCLGGRLAQWAAPRPCPTSPIPGAPVTARPAPRPGITSPAPAQPMPLPAAVPTIAEPPPSPPPPPPPVEEVAPPPPPPPPPPPAAGGAGGSWRAQPTPGAAAPAAPPVDAVAPPPSSVQEGAQPPPPPPATPPPEGEQPQ